MSRVERTKGGYRWYLVIAKRGRERLAKENLQRQDFEVYLPMYAPEPKPGAKARGLAQPQPRPFLPGYLFVAMDLNSDRWRSVFSTYGVHDVYCIGGGLDRRPQALPNRWIEQLQSRERNGLVVMPGREDRVRQLEAGDAITVPLRGCELDAVFLEEVDGRRALILVSLLGSDSRRVEVDLKAITVRRT